MRKAAGIWAMRALAAGATTTALAQEVWSPRSGHPLAMAAAWAGPFPLGTLPALAAATLTTRDPAIAAGAVVAGMLTARRAGGQAIAADSVPAAHTLLVYNVLKSNRHVALVRETVRTSGATIAVFPELHDRHARALEHGLEGWSFHFWSSSGSDGIGVASTHPLTDATIRYADYLPIVTAVTAGVTVVGVHIPAPLRPGHAAFHLERHETYTATLLETITGAGSGKDALIVAGDFNATRWTQSYRRVVRSGAGLTDAVRATTKGWFLTYPARTPFMRIDHCLVRGLRPLWARRLPAAGSDHRPLLVGLSQAGGRPGPPIEGTGSPSPRPPVSGRTP